MKSKDPSASTAWYLSKGKNWDKQDLNPCSLYNWVISEALVPWGILIHWYLFPSQIINKFGTSFCGLLGFFCQFFEWTIPDKHDFKRVECFGSLCLSGFIASWAVIHMPCAQILLMSRFFGGMTFLFKPWYTLSKLKRQENIRKCSKKCYSGESTYGNDTSPFITSPDSSDQINILQKEIQLADNKEIFF